MGIHTERPINVVPRLVLLVLFSSFILQLVVAHQRPDYTARAEDLPVAPSMKVAALATFGEQVTASRVLMLWLQAFDNQPGISIPFKDLDYERVITWLDLILMLDPRSHYPLLSASRLYTEVPDDNKRRLMLDFVYKKFFDDPNLYWPWLAHGVYVAKHRLEDNDLALLYANALRLSVTDETVPAWVTQMEIFVYEDIGDIESAKIIIGGLLDSGRISPGSTEERFLMNKLGELEE